MQLLINGEPHQIQDASTLQQLLENLGYEPKSIAVAIDGCFIPRHQYGTFELSDQQALDVVAPMQGG
ncbi:MAG: hypothetical protein K0Q50_341 [Vampirovibrio sp.]|jgi:sulfur carrier protein|nr:hypothetical protein [Vampirovibrio sp.]